MAENEDVYTEFEGRRLLVKTRRQLRLKRAWVAGIVRSRDQLENGWGTLPAGSLWCVADSYGGLHMVTMPCRCCGFRMPITSVRSASRIHRTPGEAERRADGDVEDHGPNGGLANQRRCTGTGPRQRSREAERLGQHIALREPRNGGLWPSGKASAS